jgi:hypothetical protein
MLKQKFVTYRGSRMIEGWPEMIEAAQKETQVFIRGVAHNRIRFGDETWGWQQPKCRDCSVLRGEYHVPGCDAEQCPVCGEQVFGCDCEKGSFH